MFHQDQSALGVEQQPVAAGLDAVLADAGKAGWFHPWLRSALRGPVENRVARYIREEKPTGRFIPDRSFSPGKAGSDHLKPGIWSQQRIEARILADDAPQRGIGVGGLAVTDSATRTIAAINLDMACIVLLARRDGAALRK